MRLILVRHGETLWNKQRRMQGSRDTRLTPLGLKQARALALKLKNENIDAVYTSLLQRAWATAEEILSYHPKLNLIKRPEFNERNYGVLEGMTREEAKKSFPQYFHPTFPNTLNIHMKPTEGESFEEARARVMPFIYNLMAKHPNQNILVVAHGGINKVIICTLLNWPKDKYMELHQENSCFNEFVFNGKKLVGFRINDLEHLNNLHNTHNK